MNFVVLMGTLSRDPEIRTLPSDDLLVTFDVTTRREDEPAASVPVVWFQPPERRSVLAAGDTIVVVGCARRRFFQVSGRTQSRTEVVAARVVPARHTKRARGAVDQAMAQIAEAFAAAASP